MKPWIIVGCGRRKKTEPTAAADLYTSTYITVAVRWARSVTTAERLLILSAKYGLIPGDLVIPPYDVTFGEPAAEPVVTDAVLADQIHSYGLTGSVITFAGRRYYDRLTAASRGALRPFNPFFPVLDNQGRNHQLGYQAHEMIAHRGRIPVLA